MKQLEFNNHPKRKPATHSLVGAIVALMLMAGCAGGSTPTVAEAPQPINKFDNPKLRQIYDLADRREADSLLPYLSDQSALIRENAALAYGSVQDPGAGPQLEALLQDSSSKVVLAAAWAIGQWFSVISQAPSASARHSAM